MSPCESRERYRSIPSSGFLNFEATKVPRTVPLDILERLLKFRKTFSAMSPKCSPSLRGPPLEGEFDGPRIQLEKLPIPGSRQRILHARMVPSASSEQLRTQMSLRGPLGRVPLDTLERILKIEKTVCAMSRNQSPS